MSDSLPDLTKEALVDRFIEAIRRRRVSDAISVIDSHEDAIAVGSAVSSVVKKLYREYGDVTGMIAAGNVGLDYCRRKSAAESKEDKIRELKQLGRIIAFNTAANCWPGWGDPGIIIEEAHLRDGIKLATESQHLVQELALCAGAKSRPAVPRRRYEDVQRDIGTSSNRRIERRGVFRRPACYSRPSVTRKMTTQAQSGRAPIRVNVTAETGCVPA